MRILSVVFSVCVFASTCFGQGELFKRISNHKTQNSVGVKSKKTIKVQMTGFVANEVNPETSQQEIAFDSDFAYNAQGREVLSTEREYMDGVLDNLMQYVNTYSNGVQLGKTENLNYDFGKEEYFLDGYKEYQYNNDGLLEVEYIYADDDTAYNGYYEYEYDANNLEIKSSRFIGQNGDFRLSSYTVKEYSASNLLLSEADYQCVNGDCDLSQRWVREYNSNGFIETETFYENVGMLIPYAKATFEYNSLDKPISVIEYDYEVGVFIPRQETSLIYNASNVLESIQYTVYDAGTSSWILEESLTNFVFEKSVNRDEVLLPSLFSEDFYVYNAIFAKQIKSFDAMAPNESGQMQKYGSYDFIYSNFTSISEPTVFDFTLSPNPASDVIKIGLNDNNTQRIEVYSMSGTLMHSEEINSSELSVNIQNFERGSYLVKAIGANGFRTKQFVKM